MVAVEEEEEKGGAVGAEAEGGGPPLSIPSANATLPLTSTTSPREDTTLEGRAASRAEAVMEPLLLLLLLLPMVVAGGGGKAPRGGDGR